MDTRSLRRLLEVQLESLLLAGVQQIPRGRAAPCLRTVPDGTHGGPVAQIATGGAAVVGGTVQAARSGVLSHSTSCQNAGQVVTVNEGLFAMGECDQPPVLSVSERRKALEVLERQVQGCTKCAALVDNRTQTVFGVGTITPRLCFFGEAPGVEEDKQGEPFVGRAGELLNRMIAACTLKREDVYILNVLKCRPPDNRTPLPDEVENCRPFFERQLEILHPEFICCLGACAAQALLRTTAPVGRLRGRVHTWRWAKVVVTYHPAYLLRSPQQKLAAWEDLKLLMKEMGIPIVERPNARGRNNV